MLGCKVRSGGRSGRCSRRLGVSLVVALWLLLVGAGMVGAPGLVFAAEGSPEGPTPRLSVVQADADVPNPFPGQGVAMTIRVHNWGRGALQGLGLRYVAPAGLSVSDAFSSQGWVSVWENQVQVDAGALGPGETASFVIQARVGEDVEPGTNLINEFFVLSSTEGEARVEIGLAVRAHDEALPATGVDLAQVLVPMALLGLAYWARRVRGAETL